MRGWVVGVVVWFALVGTAFAVDVHEVAPPLGEVEVVREATATKSAEGVPVTRLIVLMGPLDGDPAKFLGSVQGIVEGAPAGEVHATCVARGTKEQLEEAAAAVAKGPLALAADPEGAEHARWGVEENALPQAVLVDPEGRVAWRGNAFGARFRIKVQQVVTGDVRGVDQKLAPRLEAEIEKHLDAQEWSKAIAGIQTWVQHFPEDAKYDGMVTGLAMAYGKELWFGYVDWIAENVRSPGRRYWAVNRLLTADVEELADPDRALRMAQAIESRVIAERRSSVIRAIGTAHSRKGDHERAVEAFERAILVHTAAMADTDPRIRAAMQGALSDLEAALEAAQKALAEQADEDG